MKKLTELVNPGAVIPDLKSGDRDGVITELIGALVSSGAAPGPIRQELLLKTLERERRGSTGFGLGVAVPHVKHRTVTHLAAAIGISRRGVDFSAVDRQPVYSVILLLSPEDRPDEHLQAMEAVFKNLHKASFRRLLRLAGTTDDVMRLLADADAQQLPA